MKYFPIVLYLILICCICSISTKNCEANPSSHRFNCYPERNITQEACVARGCCWTDSLNISNINQSIQLAAPLCYYPSDFPSYKVTTSEPTAFGQRILLTLSPSTQTNDAIPNLRVDIYYETKERLRIKIYDPDHQRYEVPLNVPNVIQRVDNTDYAIDVKSEPFSLRITRNITGAVLFDSSVAPLIFQDQFIKISTALTSPLLYGLGEHRQPLVINITENWERLTFYAHDFPPVQNVNLYGVHPFHINPELDGETSNFHGQFFLNSNAMDVELQPYPALTYTTIGGIIDLYIFCGPKVEDVIAQYWDIIGKPTLPPYWSLGFHLSRYGYNNSTNLKKTINRMQAADFPYDAQWTDIDVMDSYLDFTYNNKTFGDLPDIVSSLQSLGIRYMTAIHPGISADETSPTFQQYADGVAQGIFIRSYSGSPPILGMAACGKAGFPDFSHVNISNWWSKLISDFHSQIPFDGIWLTMNEPSSKKDGSIDGCTDDRWNNPPYIPYVFAKKLFAKTLCPSAQQYLSIHYDLHNLYGYLQAKKTNEALQTILDERPFLVSRSTFAGSGKYTAHWTGDNRSTFKDMYFSIPDIINFNLFGITHVGADVCGFGLDATEELCIRWMQLGAFYPFMRNHNDQGQIDQDPASFSWEAQQIMKQALLMRYSLVPFWYTLHYEATSKSRTIVQPLFAEFPDSEEIYGIDQQFLVGRALLVSPVLISNVSTIQAYMPQDTWYEFPSGVKVSSVGQYVTLNAPLQKINVHVRGRNIIPMQVPGSNLMLSRSNPFQLLVALGDSDQAQATGNLYWDDGLSKDWNVSKAYNYFEFAEKNGNTLAMTAIATGYKNCNMQLDLVKVLGVTREVVNVTVNGTSYENYVYDADNDILIVHSLNIDMLTLTSQASITWITSPTRLH